MVTHIFKLREFTFLKKKISFLLLLKKRPGVLAVLGPSPVGQTHGERKGRGLALQLEPGQGVVRKPAEETRGDGQHLSSFWEAPAW